MSASSSSKKPKLTTSRFAWDGVPNIFNWIQFKIQFESNLTHKEKEYLFQFNADKILSVKNRLESGIDHEYKRALMRKVIEISDDIKHKKIQELTQDVEENIFLPYLWSNRQWNPSVETIYRNQYDYKGPLDEPIAELKGNVNTKIIMATEKRNIIKSHMELELNDNRYVQLASRLEALHADDHIDIPIDIENSLPNIESIRGNYEKSIDLNKRFLETEEEIPRTGILKLINRMINPTVLQQATLVRHYNNKDVIQLYKALDEQYMVASSDDLNISDQRLNSLQMAKEEYFSQFKARWDIVMVEWILLHYREATHDRPDQYRYPK
jgi:hypothetical protein